MRASNGSEHTIDLIDAASRTKVEDTRELLDNVQYAPSRGRFKVYLIDEVHMLSKSAFNALLKTLEEPPGHVKFLLATTDPQKLPVTVLSRCLQFNLKRLDEAQIQGQMTRILEAEGIAAERALLAPVRASADLVIDTSSLSVHGLRESIERAFAADPHAGALFRFSPGAVGLAPTPWNGM